MATYSNYERKRPLSERELIELAEESDEDEIIPESDDSEQDHCSLSDHNSNSEESGNDSDKENGINRVSHK